MCGFKTICEISHKILKPYTKNMHFTDFYFLFVFYDIFELWRHKPKWDMPLANYSLDIVASKLTLLENVRRRV